MFGHTTFFLSTAARWLQRLYVDMRELEERRLLINHPWREQFLHWSHDGKNWHIHGHLLPPKSSYRSTTSSGWCPGQPSSSADADAPELGGAHGIRNAPEN